MSVQVQSEILALPALVACWFGAMVAQPGLLVLISMDLSGGTQGSVFLALQMPSLLEGLRNC